MPSFVPWFGRIMLREINKWLTISTCSIYFTWTALSWIRRQISGPEHLKCELAGVSWGHTHLQELAELHRSISSVGLSCKVDLSASSAVWGACQQIQGAKKPKISLCVVAIRKHFADQGKVLGMTDDKHPACKMGGTANSCNSTHMWLNVA